MSGCGRRTRGGSGAGSAEIPFQQSQVSARGGLGRRRGCPKGLPRGKRAGGRGARPVPAAAGGSTRPGPANEFSPWEHRPGRTAKLTPRATRGTSNRTEFGLVPDGEGANTPLGSSRRWSRRRCWKRGDCPGGSPQLPPGGRQDSPTTPFVAVRHVSFLSPPRRRAEPRNPTGGGGDGLEEPPGERGVPGKGGPRGRARRAQ